jgi:thioesterase domain-containing protein
MDRQSLEADRTFAEAGGDSLRLLELIFHLELKCGVSLPLESFHGDMRPSDVAARLDECLERGADARTDLPCVVLLPGYAGDEPRLAQFRADCAHALRFVTITYPDWSALAARGSSHETVVAAIVRQIEAACGSSRLVIAGYSMGGDFAYAVATRLAAGGREIALLAVLDTDTQSSTPANGAIQSSSSTSLTRRLPHFVEVIRHDGWDGLAAAVHLNQRVESRWFLNLLRLLARLPLSPVPAAWLFQPRRHVCQALLTSKHTAWSNALVPVPQALHTVLFRSEEPRVDAAPDLGWSARCSPVDVIPVRGNHRTMFDRPQRYELSARFVEAVIEACSDTGSLCESGTQAAGQPETVTKGATRQPCRIGASQEPEMQRRSTPTLRHE